MRKSNSLTNNSNQNNSGQRDSFVFYRSFQEAINELSEAEQLIIYRMITSYALDRKETALEGTTKLVWLLVKPQLDANWRKYERGCKGGAPKGNSNAAKTTKKQLRNNLDQTNENANANVKDNDNILEEFTIPLLSDIRKYITDNRLSVYAEEFYDYYAANGWMLGKNPMKDWKATLRSWSHKTRQEVVTQPNTLSSDL